MDSARSSSSFTMSSSSSVTSSATTPSSTRSKSSSSRSSSATSRASASPVEHCNPAEELDRVQHDDDDATPASPTADHDHATESPQMSHRVPRVNNPVRVQRPARASQTNPTRRHTIPRSHSLVLHSESKYSSNPALQGSRSAGVMSASPYSIDNFVETPGARTDHDVYSNHSGSAGSSGSKNVDEHHSRSSSSCEEVVGRTGDTAVSVNAHSEVNAAPALAGELEERDNEECEKSPSGSEGLSGKRSALDHASAFDECQDPDLECPVSADKPDPQPVTTTPVARAIAVGSNETEHESGDDSELIALVSKDLRARQFLCEANRIATKGTRLKSELTLMVAKPPCFSLSPKSAQRFSSASSPRNSSARSKSAGLLQRGDVGTAPAQSPQRLGANQGTPFAYDSLDDPHCAEFHERNATFQQHWSVMKTFLKPNQRVTQRVKDAMTPIAFGPPRGASPTCISSAHDTVAPLRATHCCGTPLGTSVDVVNANTFFEKRREHLGKGLPIVVQRPLDALAVQLDGPQGLMKASAGDPWPPERVGECPKPMPPKPPVIRKVSSLSAAQLSSRPSTAASFARASSASFSSRLGSPRTASAKPAKFNARSPFLETEDRFTTFDALFFPDPHAMRTGTAAPSPYYFSRGRPNQRPGTADQQAGPAAGDSASLADVDGQRYSGLDILTETHIKIVSRSEDYSRRELQKREAVLFAKLSSDYEARTAFYAVRLKQLLAVGNAESTAREVVTSDFDASMAKLLQASRKDYIQSKLNEEVHARCPVLSKASIAPLPGADEHSIIVDLRWAGGESDAASLAILVFDAWDRYMVTINSGESLRCPMSGRPVVRSWGSFKFRAGDEAAPRATDPISVRPNARRASLSPAACLDVSALTLNHQKDLSPEKLIPPESRCSYELLLHNLSPQASFFRFVFVALNPSKTGAHLTSMFRPYLTVRLPQDHQSDCLSTSLAASGKPPASTQRRIQADTKATEYVAVRLPNRPHMACFTIASIVRKMQPVAPSMEFVASLGSEDLFDGTLRSSRPPSGSSPGNLLGVAHSRRSRTRSPAAGVISPQQTPLSALTDRDHSALSPVSPHNAHPLWNLVCHDHGDAAVPNLHRLPFVLESTLFMDETDMWIEYMSTSAKIERMSDEFYEKMFRQSIELGEQHYRALLARQCKDDQFHAGRRSNVSALAAAMMKSAGNQKVAKADVSAASPPSSSPQKNNNSLSARRTSLDISAAAPRRSSLWAVASKAKQKSGAKTTSM